MAIAKVIDWLKDPDADYRLGVSFYMELGSSNYLKKLLSTGEDDYNREKLIEELKLIAKAGATGAQPIPKTVKYVPPPVGAGEFKTFSESYKPAYRVTDFPDELQKLFIRKGELYKKACFLHTRLAVMVSDEERRQAAVQIISIMDEVQKIWDDLDYYAEFKVVRPVNSHDVERMNLIELLRRKANVRTYVTKIAKKDPKDERVNGFRNELTRIEQRIVELNDDAE